MFQTVASSQPLFFLDRYDDGPLKSTHWQSQGREASIIVELLKQASVPLCLLISFLLSKWTWISNIRWETQKTTSSLSFISVKSVCLCKHSSLITGTACALFERLWYSLVLPHYFPTFINFAFRIFNLYPLRFLSSKLSTCDQLSYRTEHMRTLSSVKPSAGHTQFMRWGCRCAQASLRCTLGLKHGQVLK